MISGKAALVTLALVTLIAGGLYLHCPCHKKNSSQVPTPSVKKGNLGKSVSDVKWTGCDGLTSYADIKNIIVTGTFTADTPINIEMIGTFLKNISVTDIDASIKLGFVTVFEEDIVFTLNGKAGDSFDQSLSTTIFIDAPSGNYKATLRFKDSQGTVLQCTLVTFKLS